MKTAIDHVATPWTPTAAAPVAAFLPRDGRSLRSLAEAGSPVDPGSGPDRNLLFAALPPVEARRLRPHLQRVQLARGQVLYDGLRTPAHAWFPTTAVVSLLCSLSNGVATEFAVVGHEGALGLPAQTIGCSNTIRAEVTCAGEAFRLPAGTIGEALAQAAVRGLLAELSEALFLQAVQASVCSRRHDIAEQLCKFLLVRLDRLPTNAFGMTHEAIANALGVRREGISQAAHRLQEDGLIRYVRGQIEILDRAGLERHACECYGVLKRQHADMMSSLLAARTPAPTESGDRPGMETAGMRWATGAPCMA